MKITIGETYRSKATNKLFTPTESNDLGTLFRCSVKDINNETVTVGRTYEEYVDPENSIFHNSWRSKDSLLCMKANTQKLIKAKHPLAEHTKLV